MKKSIALERNMAKLARLMEQAGAKKDNTSSAVNVEKFDIKSLAREAETTRSVTAHLEAEAVLRFLRNPAGYLLKTCKREQCQLPFGTDYHAVAYCSDACRAKELQSQIGIVWNPHKTPEERWGGEPPSIIPPAAMMALLGFVRKHRQLVDESEVTQTQTRLQDYYKEQGLAAGVELPTSDPETPIYSQVAEDQYQGEAIVTQVEPELSTPETEQPDQSESDSESSQPETVDPEHNHPQDVPEDNPVPTTPNEQLPQDKSVELPEEESVFDF